MFDFLCVCLLCVCFFIFVQIHNKKYGRTEDTHHGEGEVEIEKVMMSHVLLLVLFASKFFCFFFARVYHVHALPGHTRAKPR